VLLARLDTSRSSGARAAFAARYAMQGPIFPHFCMPGTVSRRVLWSLVILLVLTGAAESMVEYFRPCATFGLSCKDMSLVELVDLLQVRAILPLPIPHVTSSAQLGSSTMYAKHQ
jgi:hypothetical protein